MVVDEKIKKKMHKLQNEGVSIRKIAKKLELSPSTILKYKKEKGNYKVLEVIGEARKLEDNSIFITIENRSFYLLPIEEEEKEEIKSIEPVILIKEEKEPIEKKEEKLLELGKKLGIIRRDAVYENPWNEFEKLFCNGNDHLYSEIDEMLRRYERYNQYKQISLRSIRKIYLKWACKKYQLERKPPERPRMFKTSPLEKQVEEEIKEKLAEEPYEIVEEEKKEKLVEDKYGKRLCNDIVEKVQGTYAGATFHVNAVKRLSQALNENVNTVMSPLEIREFFRYNLSQIYDDVSRPQIYCYLLYFRLSGMLKFVHKDTGIGLYEIHRSNLIPKKKKLGILERLGMK